MCGILENEVEAIDEAMESLCSQGLIELKEVLSTLRIAAWLYLYYLVYIVILLEQNNYVKFVSVLS